MNWLQLLMLPLIFFDCLGNWLLTQSFHKTLSGEAWHQREHPYWWWCHRFIDALFFWQERHCETQAIREEKFDSVWLAWWDTFQGKPG